MQVAVISDIHADRPALERVLAAIEETGPDEIWCLGDIVGLGGRDVAEVVDLVRERCVLVLAGNHDAWVTGALTLDILPLPRQRIELTGQRAELSEDQLAWLDSLPSHARRAGLELWHGCAEDPLTGGVWGEADASAHLERQASAIGLVGHTHRASAAHRDRWLVRFGEPPPGRLELGRPGKWLLNPGAVIGSGSWLELDLAAAAARWHRR